MVLINGDLDKVRGGYYPRLFYPGLHAVAGRFLRNFSEAYYLKSFSNGGSLTKRHGEAWTLRYIPRARAAGGGGGDAQVLATFACRPPFREVEDMLRAARTAELAGG